MQQFYTTPSLYTSQCLEVAEDCSMFSTIHTLQCLLVSTVFGMVSCFYLYLYNTVQWRKKMILSGGGLTVGDALQSLPQATF